MMRKKTGRLAAQEKRRRYQNIDVITNSIYKYFSNKNRFILRNYFPNFAALKETSNYHFHFVILNHEYF